MSKTMCHVWARFSLTKWSKIISHLMCLQITKVYNLFMVCPWVHRKSDKRQLVIAATKRQKQLKVRLDMKKNCPHWEAQKLCDFVFRTRRSLPNKPTLKCSFYLACRASIQIKSFQLMNQISSRFFLFPFFLLLTNSSRFSSQNKGVLTELWSPKARLPLLFLL